jgi:hypothetical protein
MRVLKYLVGPVLALSFVGLAPSAQAAPAAGGLVGVEQSAPAAAVEKVHYRRHNHYRHYGHRHHRHYGHRHYGHSHYYARPYGYYRSSPGFYLSIGPRYGYGHRGWYW